jgi:hypothetical protein
MMETILLADLFAAMLAGRTREALALCDELKLETAFAAVYMMRDQGVFC